MRFLTYCTLVACSILVASNVYLFACSGEVEEEMGGGKYSWKSDYKLPIDYQNTEKCKCCGGTGRIKK